MPEAITPEDKEFDPAAEPESSAAWLNLLEDAEKKFRFWQEKADSIDELYASLEKQASNARDRQFAMFWSNIQVLLSSVYSRPPVPVVVPEFKERDPVKRAASELLERSLIKVFDLENIDEVMRLLRDDLLIPGRGVPWVRHEPKPKRSKGDRVCVDFLDRKDFLHDPARNWREVGWVARRAWLTRKEAKERFGETAKAGALDDLAYSVRKGNGEDSRPDEGSDPQEKAGIWEVWHEGQNRVVWVSENVETLLDSGEPHLKLEGFFPCPKPAYATLQRRSLVPVPDMLYYKDQLEEINTLTNRIHALAAAIQVKCFYPGGGEIGDAIEAALNTVDDGKVAIPVSNLAAFGNGKDMIVWLPIDMIAETISGLIEMRRQIIDDVYQIVGLSDIMRGSTESDETLGAQQLKSQYGSIRIRDKQHELVRVARDVTRIVAEIMAENFSKETLLDLSQMDLPTRAEIKAEIRNIEQAVQEQAKALEQQIQSPDAQRMAQAEPEKAQAALQQLQQQAQAALQRAQEQIEAIQALPTIDDVMELLRDQKIRPFALDIETDSTIQPDEDAEKQRRAEFLGVLGPLMQQLGELVTAKPEAAEFAGEVLKFGTAPYRVGRQLEAAIDDFVDKMQQGAGQQQQESPEQIKAKSDADKIKAEMAMRQKEADSQAQIEQMRIKAELEQQQNEAEDRRVEIEMEAERKDRELQAQMRRDDQKHEQAMELGRLQLQKVQMEIQASEIKIAGQQQDAAIRQQTAEHEAELAERGADREDERAELQADLAERAAAAREQGNGAADR